MLRQAVGEGGALDGAHALHEVRIAQGDQGRVGDDAFLQLVRMIGGAGLHRPLHRGGAGEGGIDGFGPAHIALIGAGGVGDALAERGEEGVLVGRQDRRRRLGLDQGLDEAGLDPGDRRLGGRKRSGGFRLDDGRRRRLGGGLVLVGRDGVDRRLAHGDLGLGLDGRRHEECGCRAAVEQRFHDLAPCGLCPRPANTVSLSSAAPEATNVIYENYGMPLTKSGTVKFHYCSAGRDNVSRWRPLF